MLQKEERVWAAVGAEAPSMAQSGIRETMKGRRTDYKY